jgi:hypothetical protein
MEATGITSDSAVLNGATNAAGTAYGEENLVLFVLQGITILGECRDKTTFTFNIPLIPMQQAIGNC